LVVVIGLMMLALTIYGALNPKQSRFTVPIPASATLQQPDPRTLVITQAGQSQTFRSESEWRVRGAEGEDRSAVGSASVNKFLDKENLVIVTTSASFIAIMAVGMTAIIILAGIDLSIGSVYALAAIVGAMALQKLPAEAGVLLTVPVALLVCCVVGAAAGFVNGFASVALRVHPFIITLGTMAIYRGMVFVITGGATTGAPESMQKGFFKAEAMGVYPVPTAIMLVVAVAGMVVLSRTVFGRRVYAVGGNEVAARYAGIPVGTVKTIVYTLSGALAGLSACVYLGYYGAAETNAGAGYELNVIAAAVIGGASLSGGRGSAIGAVLGAILVQLINNGMVILGIDQSYNQIVMGLAIVIAVVVDQTKARWTGN
jgi:ribose transport system permease protein